MRDSIALRNFFSISTQLALTLIFDIDVVTLKTTTKSIKEVQGSRRYYYYYFIEIRTSPN